MKSIGDVGEERAREFIKAKRKWKLLEVNWRSQQGEIDIIYYDKAQGIIHFVEVKQRNSSLRNALLSLGARKAASLRRTAMQWIKESGVTDSYQFDIVAISGDEIELRENVLT